MLNIKKIKELVLFEFRDYNNPKRIEQLFDDCIKEVTEIYNIEDNLSEEIYYTNEVKKKIYVKLLNSSTKEDEEYLKTVISRISRIIEHIKGDDEDQIVYLKYDEEVYPFMQKNYIGQDSFSSFAAKYINGYFNGYDDELEKEEEQKNLEILKNMRSYEKKLKFKF